jgi:hypothetical protein
MHPPVWPGNKPLFSPYATTKPTAYYTQVKPAANQFVDNNRHSVYVHRMTARWIWGNCPQPTFQLRIGSVLVLLVSNVTSTPTTSAGKARDSTSPEASVKSTFEQISRQLIQQGGLTPAQIFTQAQQLTHAVCAVAHTADMQPGDLVVNFLCHFWDPAWGVMSPLVRLHSSA